jgi:orotidine-5'-phosphate decarboxylase
MIMDQLYSRCLAKGPICLGLDTREGFLPEYLQKKDWSTAEKILEFNKKIIEATSDVVACYKVQIACYEALGLEGLKTYSQTLKAIKKAGNISVADIKRGDISSTAKMYAQGHYEGDFEADILTINAYMGEDAVSPYYEYLTDNNKGMFVLLRTSNPSSVDLQELKVEGEDLYFTMAEKIDQWGQGFIGESGFSSIGAVVGLTYPEEFFNIQKRMKNTFFLVPGYGAQGGTGKDISEILKVSRCAVVNSSRGLITAHQGKCEDENFAQCIREKTLLMKEDILQWLS